jgi:L-ribulokinase
LGGVGGGAWRDTGAPPPPPRPPTASSYAPSPEAGAVYDRVYAIFRELHDILGQSHANLLHELKRVRIERRSR